MHRASRTMSQPVRVRHVVSRTRVPGRYRRPAGTMTPLGANRKAPAARSRMAANTLGLSGRGRHIHSTRPLGAMRALTSQSERKAYSAMGGKALAMWPMEGAIASSGAARLPPLTAGSTGFPRSSMRAFLAMLRGRGESYAGCAGLVQHQLLDGLAHLVEHHLHLAHAVDLQHRRPQLAVMAEHRRRAVVVLAHALQDRVSCVVGPALDRGPMQQAVDEGGLGHVERNDKGDPSRREHSVERLGLLGGPGEAIQEHVGGGVDAAQAALDDAVDQVVGDEVTGGHDAGRLIADGASMSDLRAQDLAGRQVRHAELFFDSSRLRALAAAWWSENESNQCGDCRRSGSEILRRLCHQLIASASSSRAWAAG